MWHGFATRADCKALSNSSKAYYARVKNPCHVDACDTNVVAANSAMQARARRTCYVNQKPVAVGGGRVASAVTVGFGFFAGGDAGAMSSATSVGETRSPSGIWVPTFRATVSSPVNPELIS